VVQRNTNTTSARSVLQYTPDSESAVTGLLGDLADNRGPRGLAGLDDPAGHVPQVPVATVGQQHTPVIVGDDGERAETSGFGAERIADRQFAEPGPSWRSSDSCAASSMSCCEI